MLAFWLLREIPNYIIWIRRRMVTMVSIWQYNKIIDSRFSYVQCTHTHIPNSKQMVKFSKCTHSYPTGRQYFYFVSIHKTNINSLNPIECTIHYNTFKVYVKHSCDVRNMLHFHWQLSKASRRFFCSYAEWASYCLMLESLFDSTKNHSIPLRNIAHALRTRTRTCTYLQHISTI